MINIGNITRTTSDTYMTGMSIGQLQNFTKFYKLGDYIWNHIMRTESQFFLKTYLLKLVTHFTQFHTHIFIHKYLQELKLRILIKFLLKKNNLNFL